MIETRKSISQSRPNVDVQTFSTGSALQSHVPSGGGADALSGVVRFYQQLNRIAPTLGRRLPPNHTVLVVSRGFEWWKN